MISMVCIFLLAATFPFSVSATTAATPAFTFIGVDRVVVTAGQPITFTIRTINANAVFASTGGAFVHGVRQAAVGQANQATWLLTITPTVSQTVIIYANTSNIIEGAASVTLPITVNASTSINQPTGQVTTQSGRHQILSITEIPSRSTDTVTLRIVTDAAAQNVWLRLGENRNLQATRVSNTATQRTWEVSYRPARFVPHQVHISANHAFVNDAFATSQTFMVNLTAPVDQDHPQITRVSASPSNIVVGERSTITVRTNLDVTHVWAEVDGRQVNARRNTSSATTRSWTMDVSPNRTQTISVYANTSNSVHGADRDSIRITVVETDPRINSMSIRDSLIEWGQWTVIDVNTNNDVEHVWAMVDGRRVNARRQSSNNRNQTWTIDVSPDRSQTIRVYANAFNNDQGADVFSVRVNVH